MVMIVLILCGIPGAGKSSFANRFMVHCQDQLPITCQYVSFDVIGNSIARDEESFSKIRIEALSQLQRIINDKIHLNANNTNAITDVVIVDDLMHLHSMRRDVYKLTRDLQVPQVVVHVKTDLTTALERNALRNATERIPDEVVTRLYHQMEEPNTAAIADRHNCTINGQSFESAKDGVAAVITEMNLVLQQWRQTKSTRVLSGDTHPSAPSEAGPLSALDRHLRDIIAAIMKNLQHSAPDTPPVSGSQGTGRLLSVAKTRTLQQARADLREALPVDSEEARAEWLEGWGRRFVGDVQSNVGACRTEDHQHCLK